MGWTDKDRQRKVWKTRCKICLCPLEEDESQMCQDCRGVCDNMHAARDNCRCAADNDPAGRAARVSAQAERVAAVMAAHGGKDGYY